MESKTKFFLEFSHEIKDFLNENKINIRDLLNKSEIDFFISFGVSPSHESKRSKDLIPIIIASSAALFTLCLSLNQLLRTIYNKPTVVEVIELEEIKEGDNILKDEHGQPILKEKKRYEIMETSKKELENYLEFSISLKNGVLLKIKQTYNDNDV